MREPMHPIYTAVPLRSVRAYAKREPVTLEAVLCAAIVDPANAEDAFEEYGTEGTPHSLQDFWEWRGAKGVDLALQVVSQWTMEQRNPSRSIYRIILWHHRLGVWCACQAARTALPFVLVGEERPRVAIETAERWVIGDATIDEVCDAADDAATTAAAYADAAGAERAAAYAATAAAEAAIADAVHTASYAVTLAADAARVPNSDDTELIRIREVVAEACLTFPR